MVQQCTNSVSRNAFWLDGTHGLEVLIWHHSLQSSSNVTPLFPGLDVIAQAIDVQTQINEDVCSVHGLQIHDFDSELTCPAPSLSAAPEGDSSKPWVEGTLNGPHCLPPNG